MNPVHAWIGLILAAAFYSVPVIFTYSERFRAGQLIWVIGLTFPAIADLIWIAIAKKMTDQNEITYYLFAWELVFRLFITAIPVLYFGLKLNPISWAGICLFLIGFWLLKIGTGQ